MYKQIAYTGKNFSREIITGETIEEKIERILENNEPIKDGAPIIYTEKANGVMAGYDIRTDRFEVALEGINQIQKSETAKRNAKMSVVKDDEVKPIGGTEQVENQ